MAPNPVFAHNLAIMVMLEVQRNWGYIPENGDCMPTEQLSERLAELGYNHRGYPLPVSE